MLTTQDRSICYLRWEGERQAFYDMKNLKFMKDYHWSHKCQILGPAPIFGLQRCLGVQFRCNRDIFFCMREHISSLTLPKGLGQRIKKTDLG